jgi:hypothetical protein
VSANELYEHSSERIGDVHDQAIFIARNVEDEAIIAHKIDIGAEHRLYVCRTCDGAYLRIPKEILAGLGVVNRSNADG